MSRNCFLLNIVIVLMLFRNIGRPRMVQLCLSIQEKETDKLDFDYTLRRE